MARKDSAVSRFRVKGEHFNTKPLVASDPLLLKLLKKVVRNK